MELFWIYTFIYSWLFIFGASIFSFLNVVIYRVPQGIFWEESRSYCPCCNHKLGGLDLIPIFSYMFLGRKCRYCKTKISIRYPSVELLGAVIAMVSFYIYGFNPKTLVTFLLFAILTCVAFVDWDTMEIPDIFHILIIPVVIASFMLWTEIGFWDRLIGFFAISLPMLTMTIFITDAFGGGDIKLMAVCGAFLGWKYILLAFFISLLFGGSYGIYLMATKKNQEERHMAFGPYLCLGIGIALLFGERILDFYLKLYV